MTDILTDENGPDRKTVRADPIHMKIPSGTGGDFRFIQDLSEKVSSLNADAGIPIRLSSGRGSGTSS